MKKTFILPLLIVFLLTFTAKAEIRTWTSAAGNHTIEAEFAKISEDGKIVTLRDPAGKETNVAVERLSKTDQEHLQKRTGKEIVVAKLPFKDIFEAARSGTVEDVKSFVEKGVDVNIKNANGSTPLHLAALADSLPVVKYLIETYKNQVRKEQLARLKQELAILPQEVAELLQERRNAEQKEEEAWEKLISMADRLEAENDPAEIRVLKRLCDELVREVRRLRSERMKFIQLQADRQLRLEQVKMWLEQDPVQVQMKYELAIELAVEMTERKLGYINSKNNNNTTALHSAARAASLEVVEYLIGEGADPNLRTNHGETPLHHAARYSTFSVLRYLVSNGAVPFALNVKGERPIHLVKSDHARLFLRIAEDTARKEMDVYIARIRNLLKELDNARARVENCMQEIAGKSTELDSLYADRRRMQNVGIDTEKIDIVTYDTANIGGRSIKIRVVDRTPFDEEIANLEEERRICTEKLLPAYKTEVLIAHKKYREEAIRQFAYVKNGGLLGRPEEDIRLWFNEDTGYLYSPMNSPTTRPGNHSRASSVVNEKVHRFRCEISGQIATFRVRNGRVTQFEER